jgi:hypothetical protein
MSVEVLRELRDATWSKLPDSEVPDGIYGKVLALFRGDTPHAQYLLVKVDHGASIIWSGSRREMPDGTPVWLTVREASFAGVLIELLDGD